MYEQSITTEVNVVEGGVNSSLIAGDTSAAFGRINQDNAMLHVVTNVGPAHSTPGGVVRGKIVAFDALLSGQ